MITIPTPADIDPAAKPYDAKPSASVITKTANAIDTILRESPIAAFDTGTYWVDRTVSVNGASTKQTRRQIHFHLTELHAAGSLDAYTAVRSEGDGSDLAGLDDTSDNLPAGETTKVLLDVTNSNYSRYAGLLTLHCGGLKLAAIAATNRHRQNGAGGIGSVWDSVIISDYYWGLFGTPRYGQSRNYYAGAFVGNIWSRLRIVAGSKAKYPFLLASNTGDDQFFGEVNIINPAGGRSYLYSINLNCGSLYLGGNSDNDYCIDIQKASLNAGSLYAEGDFDTPIIVRNLGYLKATPKYGAGSVTTFKQKAFVTAAGQSGGGHLFIEPTSSASKDIEAMVYLTAVQGSKRNWIVEAPFSETEFKPFKGSGLSGQDRLASFFSEGGARWTGANLQRQAMA